MVDGVVIVVFPCLCARFVEGVHRRDQLEVCVKDLLSDFTEDQIYAGMW